MGLSVYSDKLFAGASVLLPDNPPTMPPGGVGSAAAHFVGPTGTKVYTSDLQWWPGSLSLAPYAGPAQRVWYRVEGETLYRVVPSFDVFGGQANDVASLPGVGARHVTDIVIQWGPAPLLDINPTPPPDRQAGFLDLMRPDMGRILLLVNALRGNARKGRKGKRS